VQLATRMKQAQQIRLTEFDRFLLFDFVIVIKIQPEPVGFLHFLSVLYLPSRSEGMLLKGSASANTLSILFDGTNRFSGNIEDR